MVVLGAPELCRRLDLGNDLAVVAGLHAGLRRECLLLLLGRVEENRRAVLAPEVPTPVWGRDELGAGEMWNSNSVISWLLARSGLPVEAIHPPAGGRAPGWHAGLVVARRDR